jgi:hypothetical protein
VEVEVREVGQSSLGVSGCSGGTDVGVGVGTSF